MKGKNGILLLLLAALVLGPILWQIAPRPMVTPEEAEQTAELCLGVGDPWLASQLTLTDPEEIREMLEPFTQKHFRRGKPGGGDLAMQFLLYSERGKCLAVLQETAAGGTLQLKRGIRFYHPVREDPAFEALYRSLRERMEARA